jgi:hypothetical protein
VTLRELLLLAVVGWTAIGLLGVCVSLKRGERAKAVHGGRWIGGIWVVYLVVLVGVSLLQPQKVVPLGKDQCYDDMCFAVMSAEQVPVYTGQGMAGRGMAGDGSRLLRISIRIKNKGKSAQSEGLIRAYLVDAQGRRWEPLPGLAGVRLAAKVAGGDSVTSEPVFKVAADASGLALIFTHGHWQPGVLMIGDSDSWWHKRTMVALGF